MDSHDTDYVSLVFQGFLLRGVDAGTLSAFGSALTAGTITHGSLVNTLLASAEFNQFVAPVSRLYMAAFRRVPDAGGLNNWVAYVRAGNSLQSAADAFVASQEFQLTYGSLNDTQYVTLLYENVLGREPDPTGLATWTGQLGSGTSRGGVLIGFSESQEGMALFAPTVRTFLHYFTFLNATPPRRISTTGRTISPRSTTRCATICSPIRRSPTEGRRLSTRSDKLLAVPSPMREESC